jgi:hypothetical protein
MSARTTDKAKDYVQAIGAWNTAYPAYQPREVLRGTVKPSPEAWYKLLAAMSAILWGQPRTPAELGSMVRVGCIVGIHEMIRRTCRRPHPDAVAAYDRKIAELERLPLWFLATAAGYVALPDEIEPGARGGDFIGNYGVIDELLESAGLGWPEMIRAAAETLKAAQAADNQTPASALMPFRLPYGKWTCADGLEVLFDRYYSPMWAWRPGECTTAADPSAQVRWSQMDHFHGAERRAALAAWGVPPEAISPSCAAAAARLGVTVSAEHIVAVGEESVL